MSKQYPSTLVTLIGIIALLISTAVAQDQKPSNPRFNTISREEVEMLLADVAKSNPMLLKRLAEDPEMKKQQLANLEQLLAFASEAQKQGLADDEPSRQELAYIRAEIEASNYDREINKGTDAVPFSLITDEQIKELLSDSQADLDRFLKTKMALMRSDSAGSKPREITAEEKAAAGRMFANIRIYQKEFEAKARSGAMPAEFFKKVALQVKLQQAQFLARLLSDKLASRTEPTDDEVRRYIAQHTELTGTKAARTKEARTQLKEEEENRIIAELVVSHNVSVPDDFTVPEVTDERLQQAMKAMQKEMKGVPGPTVKRSTAKKPVRKRT
jgi:hypothetical protein